MQFKRAMQGSDAMLIHLGKSVLGQTYKLDVTTKRAPTVVYFERAHSPRDAELNRPDGALFHIHGNGRDPVVELPFKDAEIGDGGNAQTVTDPSQVEAEIRSLFTALGD